MRLVEFRYTDDYRARNPAVEDRAYLNVIAQEFREVFPDWVQGSGEYLLDGEEILQVDPYPITVYAAAAVQELAGSLESQEREVTALRAAVESIQRESAGLRRQLAEIVARLESSTAM